MTTQTRRTRTYVAFDGDTDLMSYRTIQGWSADPNNSFSLNDAHELTNARDDSLPESIINQLKPRLDASKHLLLIIGSSTNTNRKGILQYELRYALRNSLPIFLVFKGYDDANTKHGDSLWKALEPKIPATIRNADKADKYCLVMPFTRARVSSAVKGWSNSNPPGAGYTWHWA